MICAMPTTRPRISVTKDPALADALARGRALLGVDTPEATILHDLAVHGARLLGEEQGRRDRAVADLADHDWLDSMLDSDALAAVESAGLPTPR